MYWFNFILIPFSSNLVYSSYCLLCHCSLFHKVLRFPCLLQQVPAKYKLLLKNFILILLRNGSLIKVTKEPCTSFNGGVNRRQLSSKWLELGLHVLNFSKVKKQPYQNLKSYETFVICSFNFPSHSKQFWHWTPLFAQTTLDTQAAFILSKLHTQEVFIYKFVLTCLFRCWCICLSLL